MNVLDVSILHPGVDVYRRVVFSSALKYQWTWSYFRVGYLHCTMGTERRPGNPRELNKTRQPDTLGMRRQTCLSHHHPILGSLGIVKTLHVDEESPMLAKGHLDRW
jgi:hypothetical protein